MVFYLTLYATVAGSGAGGDVELSSGASQAGSSGACMESPGSPMIAMDLLMAGCCDGPRPDAVIDLT